MKYGVEGYGLYFYCVEIIAGNLSSEHITFELEHDAETIAYRLKMDTLKVEEIMKYMVSQHLFEFNRETQRIVCLTLAKRVDVTMSQNQDVKNIVSNSNYKKLLDPNSRLDKIRLDETRKKESAGQAGSDYTKEFEEWWDVYGKIGSKKKAARCYRSAKRKGATVQDLLDSSTRYRQAQESKGTDRRYILHASTFLGPDDHWKDWLKVSTNTDVDEHTKATDALLARYRREEDEIRGSPVDVSLVDGFRKQIRGEG